MKTLDHMKVTPNANIVHQKVVLQKVNVLSIAKAKYVVAIEAAKEMIDLVLHGRIGASKKE